MKSSVHLIFLLLSILTVPLTLTVPSAQAGSYALTSIDYPSGDETFLTGINNQGKIAGNYRIQSFDGSFIYDNVNFTLIPMWDGRETVADGINNAGKVCGNNLEQVSSNTYRMRGFIYDEIYDTFDRVSYDDAYSNYARDINNKGEVLGSSGSSTFVLDIYGHYRSISLPSSSDYLYGFNDNGLSVGKNYSNNKALIFNLTNSDYSYFTFPAPADPNVILRNTSASGINNNGTIVGNYYVSDELYNYYFYGFVKDGDSFTTIAYPGATETWIWGINDLNQIVGQYADSDGVYHGFIGNPVPIPSTLLLLGTGLFGLGALNWRRKRG